MKKHTSIIVEYTCTLSTNQLLMSYSVVVDEPFSHTICRMCSKPYDDPRILPCLHSFCQQCLHREIVRSCSQQAFKCPTCERNVNIPVGGASVFPQNLHLGLEAEMAGNMSKIVNGEVCCEQCLYGSSGPAVVFCCTCCRFMCTFCHEYHKHRGKMSEHNVVGLDQEGAEMLQTSMKPREYYCSQPNHEHNKLEFYCETCKCLVCGDCRTTVAHKDHSVTELSTVAKTHQMEIKGALRDANLIVTKMTEAIDGNDKMIEKMMISKENAIKAINQAFEILQQTLEDRKKTLLSEIEAIALSTTTALNLQEEQFKKIVEDIGHYTEMASHILKTHTEHEVVALGGLIPTELQGTVKRAQTISLAPNQRSDIQVSVHTDKLVRKLSNLGRVSELSLSPSSCTWTSTSVAKVGTRFMAKVQSKTKEWDGYPHGGVQVKAEMRSKAHDGAVLCGEVEDHKDGTYTITLTPEMGGPHQLLITMDGQHVQMSPYDLDVMDITKDDLINTFFQVHTWYCINQCLLFHCLYI